jgi:protocatechuate 3,4-dioxygenase alpha subunit
MMAIYGGGIPYRYVTRMYLAGEPANAADPVIQLVPAERRDTLIASRDGACFTFEIRLQGPGETVFFDV